MRSPVRTAKPGIPARPGLTTSEAERWLAQPALGLDRRKPIDLLKTHPGARLVAQYLTRIEYGVYT